MLGSVQSILLVLFCAVGFVLLIACANIANLLLARSTARMREFAVRAALGAGKSRLIRLLLTESILLGAMGGALGLLLASWGMRAALAALAALPDTLPRAAEIQIDLRVLLFTAVATLLAGIFFGLVPALKISRTNLQDSLKEQRARLKRLASPRSRHFSRRGNGARSGAPDRRRPRPPHARATLERGSRFQSAQRPDLRLLALAFHVADQPRCDSRIVPRR